MSGLKIAARQQMISKHGIDLDTFFICGFIFWPGTFKKLKKESKLITDQSQNDKLAIRWITKIVVSVTGSINCMDF